MTSIETIAIPTITLCGCRGYGYGQRGFRHERTRADLADAGRDAVHRTAGCDGYRGRSRRRDGNRERLRYGLQLRASAASVARLIRNHTLHLDSGHIEAGAYLRNANKRELGSKHGDSRNARRIAETLRNVHNVLERRSGRACRKRGGNDRRLDFVATHKFGVLVWPPTNRRYLPCRWP